MKSAHFKPETGALVLSDHQVGTVQLVKNLSSPLKGTMSGPNARAPFDDVMEHTPDAPRVTYDKSTVGGVPGIWCTPEGGHTSAKILFFASSVGTLEAADEALNLMGAFLGAKLRS
jgi:hypothetical protein